MRRKVVFAAIVIIIIAVSAVLYVVYLDGIGSKTLVVPDDYATIGWAVGNATAGDTVYVRSGIYNESLTIDKPLSFIGENSSNTILIGGYAGITGSGSTVGIKADNITVSGFTIRSYDFETPAWYFNGIWVAANNCNITGNIIENCDIGIACIASPVFSIVISKNVITENLHTGIYVGREILQNSPAHDIVITDNNITANSWGIGITEGFSYVISGNNVIDNGGGIGLHSSDSTIVGNNVTSNRGAGIHIGGLNNTISGNYVADNEVGVTFEGSTTTDNMFYSNSFDNDQNVQITSTNYTESWDNGTVGNYWSDYTTKYPNATEVDNTGIWNTPYVIDTNNTDRYPRVK